MLRSFAFPVSLRPSTPRVSNTYVLGQTVSIAGSTQSSECPRLVSTTTASTPTVGAWLRQDFYNESSCELVSLADHTTPDLIDSVSSNASYSVRSSGVSQYFSPWDSVDITHSDVKCSTVQFNVSTHNDSFSFASPSIVSSSSIPVYSPSSLSSFPVDFVLFVVTFSFEYPSLVSLFEPLSGCSNMRFPGVR